MQESFRYLGLNVFEEPRLQLIDLLDLFF